MGATENISTDIYRSIPAPAEGLFKDNGSRFIALAYPVETEEEVKEIVASLKKKYHDARHHCFAYRLGHKGDRFRAKDDGEPSSSAGRPILGQIDSRCLSDVLVVVVRYFGGIKLGTGGLVRAYTSSAKLGLEAAGICDVEEMCLLTYEVDYTYLAKLQNLSSSEDIFTISDIAYTDVVSVTLCTPPERQEEVMKAVTNLTGGKGVLKNQGLELVKI